LSARSRTGGGVVGQTPVRGGGGGHKTSGQRKDSCSGADEVRLKSKRVDLWEGGKKGGASQVGYRKKKSGRRELNCTVLIIWVAEDTSTDTQNLVPTSQEAREKDIYVEENGVKRGTLRRMKGTSKKKEAY